MTTGEAHRTMALFVALSLWGALVLGCEPAAPAPAGAARRALEEEPPALAPPDTWLRFSLDPTRAVTPRFSPSGAHLLVRGDLGVGLFLFARRDGELLYAEEGYRGDARFTEGGDLCRGPRGEARSIRLDGGGQPFELPGAQCDLIRWDERFGEQLQSGPEGAVYHHPFEGTVTRVTGEGAARLVSDQGVWNVAVSADGRRIAWAQGTLSDPVLTVHDQATGPRRLGRGVHPTWSPRGRFLLFSRPVVSEGLGGELTYDAELFVYDASTEEVTQLTDTPSIAEMQPALSPDGASVAFADWEGGVVYLADAVGLGGGGR